MADPETRRWSDLLTPVLTKNWGDERAWKLTNYEHGGGYAALRTALGMAPGRRGRPWSRTPACAAAAAPASRPE